MDDKLGKEILKIKTDSEQYAVSKTKELLKVYKRNLDDIQNQIANIYMKYTTDGELNISTKQRYNALHQLEKQLAAQMKELGETNVAMTTDILTDTFNDTYYKTAYALDKGLETGIDFALLKPEVVKAAIERPIEGKMFSDRIWNNSNKLAKRVKSDVEKALAQGKSPEKLATQIKNNFGSSAYQAKRLINTEVAKTVSMAQEEIYKNSDAVNKIMWDATLENNTCSECAELDGKMWDVNKDHPSNPLHPSCRCCWIPVPAIDGWSPTKKRENVKDPVTGEKKVIEYLPYNQWSTYTKAKQYEPMITKDLKNIVSKSDSKLEGLEFKLKTQDSFVRKVKSDMLSGRNEKNVLNSTYDIVRYTNVSDAEKFTENYFDMVDSLNKNGYNIIRVKNTLSDPSAPYRGINAVIQNSDGFKFELQFHTEQSFQIKQLNHKLYEKIRQDGVPAKEKAVLTKQMMDNSLKTNAPKGVKDIKPFDNTTKEGN